MTYTKAQQSVLASLPFVVTMWGGRPMTRWPAGVNPSALEALIRAGVVKSVGLKSRPFAVKYRLVREDEK